MPSLRTAIRNLAGFMAIADKVTGSKEVRAEPFAAHSTHAEARSAPRARPGPALGPVLARTLARFAAILRALVTPRSSLRRHQRLDIRHPPAAAAFRPGGDVDGGAALSAAGPPTLGGLGPGKRIRRVPAGVSGHPGAGH
jgi:hypothetical protein